MLHIGRSGWGVVLLCNSDTMIGNKVGLLFGKLPMYLKCLGVIGLNDSVNCTPTSDASH